MVDIALTRRKDIPGMDGARAAAVWVTADGLPTNDNNTKLFLLRSQSLSVLTRKYSVRMELTA